MRFIALDVHRDFCEVAISEDGVARPAGRVGTSPAELQAFATSLAPDDQVALETTGNAGAVVRLLEPYVAGVVIANPKAVKAISHAKAKTDKIDAKTLVKLFASGFLPAVWAGDEKTRILRRLISRRVTLVRSRGRVKNEIHAVLHRNLKGRPPPSDLFGKRRREWLSSQVLPADEAQTVESCLRQLNFLNEEIDLLDAAIARHALDSKQIRRLITVPGINAITAAAFMAAVGDISRFPTPRQLVSYLGLDPKVRQSGVAAPRYGAISKQGASEARHMLVEAAWVVARTPGPLRAFAERVRARRGTNVATVAVARKLAVLFWHLLARDEDYAYARPSLTREKIRRLELSTGAERRVGYRNPVRVFAAKEQHLREREIAVQAEVAYRRLMKDWKSQGVRVPPPGRASTSPK